MGNQSALRQILIPVLATALGLLAGTIFIAAIGASAGEAYQAFFRAVAGGPRQIGETLVATIPLVFTGLAIALAFRCGLFNIGAEGQYMVAQIAAAWAGYALTFPGWLHPLVVLIAGMAAGAAWGAVPGLLKAYRGVHEVINSIMMNYVALFFTSWIVRGVLRAASTPEVKPTAVLVQGLIPESRLHAGLWVALLAAFLVWLFLWKTPAGYEIRAVGLAPGAAEYAGISVPRNIVTAMMLSGALAGLAGAVQVIAINGRFFEPMGFVGFGLDGIAVSLVGRNHPVGVLLAALLFGALGRGGPAMQAAVGIPKAVIWIVQGVVIFFVAAEGLWRFLKSRRPKKEVKSA